MKGSILIVDDEPSILTLLEKKLTKEGYSVSSCKSGEEAIQKLTQNGFDLVLIDLYLQGTMTGFSLMDWLNEHRPQIPKVVLSGTTKIQDVVEAVHRGAFDFVLKPIEYWEVFLHQINRAIEHKKYKEEREELHKELQNKNIELENKLGELELAHQLLQAQFEIIQQDIHRAERIQRALLPKTLPKHEKCSLAVYFKPLNRIGGDFFDIFDLDANHISLYIADTSGHGIASSLVTTFLKYTFQPVKLLSNSMCQIIPPNEILRSLNEKLSTSGLGSDMFMSLCYAVVDFEHRSIEIANAGHPSILWRHGKDNSIEAIRVPAPALGIVPSAKFSSMAFQWEQNDSFLFYTDGLLNIQDQRGNKFTQQGLIQLLEQDTGNPEEMVLQLNNIIEEWTNSSGQKDDISLLWLTFRDQPTNQIKYYPPIQPLKIATRRTIREIAYSIQNNTCFIKITGTGTWREAYGLFNFLQKLRTERKDIDRWIFDFSECSQLESTFFGVLHQICTESEKNNVPQVFLQNIGRPLLKEFSELGLADILVHYLFEPEPLPTETLPLNVTDTQEQMIDFILSAHETLIQANPQNASRFENLIALLKSEKEKKQNK